MTLSANAAAGSARRFASPAAPNANPVQPNAAGRTLPQNKGSAFAPYRAACDCTPLQNATGSRKTDGHQQECERDHRRQEHGAQRRFSPAQREHRADCARHCELRCGILDPQRRAGE